MFAPLSIPEPFDEGFPRGFPVRPSQIRAESQDAATMVPGVLAMRGRFRELKMPVTIMAGEKDYVVDIERHAIRLQEEIPQSILRLVPGAGHMVHHAVPDEVAEAIEEVSAAALRQPQMA